MKPLKTYIPVANEMRWPRITLVTPVLNGARYIESAIRSVIFQGYPNLEYIIVDGGSTDGTIEVIRKWSEHLAWWVSEPDGGMYDALNKGFARSSGEIMGWLSASDMLHVGSLWAVASVFMRFPEVEWITGIPTHFNEFGMTVGVSRLPRWSRIRFLVGANQYIQQESTFWRRSLWEKAGGCLDASLKMGGDFELWVRFFRHARLYSVNALIGGFRMHRDSLGLANIDECHRVHDDIIRREIKSARLGRSMLILYSLSKFLLRLRLLGRLYRVVLYRLPGPDWPPVIRYDLDRGWVMVS